MSVEWCAQCQVPLTEEEAAGGRCLTCGAEIARPVFEAPPPPPKVPPFFARWRPWAVVALVLLALVAGGLIGAQWPRPSADRGPEPGDRANAADTGPKKGQEAKPPADANRKEERREAAAPVSPPGSAGAVLGARIGLGMASPPADAAGPPAVAARPVTFPGPPDERQPLRAAVNPRYTGNEIILDDPEGEFVVDAIPVGQQRKLSGKVRRLRVSGNIGQRAFLDATRLQAKEILVEHTVGMDAQVKLNAPNGWVEFRGPIQTRSRLFVTAPDGTVSFHSNVGSLQPDTQVTVTAGNIEFANAIQGWNTVVDVTVTSGGRLKFKELTNGARLHYRRADPRDAAVAIVPGSVRAQAELLKVD